MLMGRLSREGELGMRSPFYFFNLKIAGLQSAEDLLSESKNRARYINNRR